MTENPIPVQKPILVIYIVVVIIIAGAICFFLLPGMQYHGSQYCRLDDSGKLLDNCIPLFRIVNGTNDTIQYENDSLIRFMVPAPPAEECNHYAEIALEPYGGLPNDAVFIKIENGQQGGTYNPTTKVSSPSVVETRRIYYRQRPYGMPILGNAGRMEVEIGADGILPEIYKHWFTLEETGLTRIVPQSEAVQRLRNGQCHNIPDLALNLTIHDMMLGYYPPVNRTVPQYLEPVWIVNATDEIRGSSLQFYVPAEPDASEWDLFPDVPIFQYRNFTQIRNDSIQPDMSYPVKMWLGGSGPIGKEKATDAIKSFTEKPDINLTYVGRFFEHGSGGCGGSSYFWDYYEFSTPDCNFRVDAYTGTMLLASLNTSCSNAKIRSFTLAKKMVPSESTISEVTNFTRERYYHFDQRHMKLKRWVYPSHDNDYFRFTGDKALQSYFEVWLFFRPMDGLLTNYRVRDDVVEYACAGGKAEKIREE